MAITQEEYDKIEIGDELTVAQKEFGDWITFSGVAVAGNYTYTSVPWAIKNGRGILSPLNILPDKGGKDTFILSHTPKPKPEWMSAKVIKNNYALGTRFYLKHGTIANTWVDSLGNTFSTDSFVNNNVKIEIVEA